MFEFNHNIKGKIIVVTNEIMISISELSTKDLNNVASIWAIKRELPHRHYMNLLKRVRKGEIEVDELPLFICKILNELGYEIPIIKIV
ncbi:hypothetical protein BTO06_09930 [Tenacibaculum sp. SZ-18]|nr:hypothetical protein BTO06_09930 [Tenacibaculum sp. SZ-18]